MLPKHLPHMLTGIYFAIIDDIPYTDIALVAKSFSMNKMNAEHELFREIFLKYQWAKISKKIAIQIEKRLVSSIQIKCCINSG